MNVYIVSEHRTIFQCSLLHQRPFSTSKHGYPNLSKVLVLFAQPLSHSFHHFAVIQKNVALIFCPSSSRMAVHPNNASMVHKWVGEQVSCRSSTLDISPLNCLHEMFPFLQGLDINL